jgi:hypothetical protein
MRFFTPSMTEETIKTVYRNLAMRHHPDRGGDTATMQELNAEYEQALKGAYRAAGYTEEKAADRWSMDAELVEVAAEIYRTSAALNVEICGVWLWITGETRKHADALKALHCRWSPKKTAWYFRREQDGGRRFHKRAISLDEIRAKYGSATIPREGGARADERQERRYEQAGFALA